MKQCTLISIIALVVIVLILVSRGNESYYNMWRWGNSYVTHPQNFQPYMLGGQKPMRTFARPDKVLYPGKYPVDMTGGLNRIPSAYGQYRGGW